MEGLYELVALLVRFIAWLLSLFHKQALILSNSLQAAPFGL